MAEVFGRKYSLIVGKPDAFLVSNPVNSDKGVVLPSPLSRDAEIIVPGPTNPLQKGITGGVWGITPSESGYVDLLTRVRRAVEVTELRIRADINSTKTTRSVSSQPATIGIYNLSKDSQARIEDNDIVILRAGYDQDAEPPAVYIGQIVSVVTKKQGRDTITELVCGEAYTAKKNVKISYEWPPDTTYLQVIQDFIKFANRAGVPLGHFINRPGSGQVNTSATPVYLGVKTTAKLLPEFDSSGTPAQQILRPSLSSPLVGGYSVEGQLFELLQSFCTSIGYRSYTVQSALYIEPLEYVPLRETVDIGPENIKGNIRPESDGSTNLAGSTQKNGKGLSLTTFLNGNISTIKQARISGVSDRYDGTYRIDSVTHKLDSEGSEWDTEIDCVRI